MIGSRALLLSLSLVSLVSLVGACGGKVVVDATNQGGGGAGSSTNSSSVSVGVGGACGGLEGDLLATLAAAQVCDPQGSNAQCSGLVVAFDACGCTVAANNATPETAANSINAFNTWVSAGCGPYECFACPPAPTPAQPWFCSPTKNNCTPPAAK